MQIIVTSVSESEQDSELRRVKIAWPPHEPADWAGAAVPVVGEAILDPVSQEDAAGLKEGATYQLLPI